jgi:1-deoxy-D-xylulose-5-phosphate synthase
MGTAVLEFMADNGYTAQVKRLGIPDKFIDHGEQLELHAECGFDITGIKKSVKEMLKHQVSTSKIASN